MDLIKTLKNKKQMTLLIRDHCPNQAMRNEFQTMFFSLKILKMELMEGECEGYIVEEGGVFLVVSLQIKNLSNEIVSFRKGDLLISYDKENAYEAEENFGVAHQLDDEIALKPNEEVKGKLIYVIASNAKRITFRYLEYYDDESEKQYKLKYLIDC